MTSLRRVAQIFFISILSTQLISEAALANSETQVAKMYRDCINHSKKRNSNTYAAWIPGVAWACVASQFPKKSATKHALDLCRRNKVLVERSMSTKIRDSCSLAIVDGKITSRKFKELLKREPYPISVEIRIYEHSTNRTTSRMGLYSESSFERGLLGSSKAAFTVRIAGAKEPICNGNARMRWSKKSLNAKYRATCYKGTFLANDRVKLNKLIKSDGVYRIAPRRVVARDGGNWIEIRF